MFSQLRRHPLGGGGALRFDCVMIQDACCFPCVIICYVISSNPGYLISSKGGYGLSSNRVT